MDWVEFVKGWTKIVSVTVTVRHTFAAWVRASCENIAAKRIIAMLDWPMQ